MKQEHLHFLDNKEVFYPCQLIFTGLLRKSLLGCFTKNHGSKMHRFFSWQDKNLTNLADIWVAALSHTMG